MAAVVLLELLADKQAELRLQVARQQLPLLMFS
jgi:hypothetical protein